jgi:hypothetical protein
MRKGIVLLFVYVAVFDAANLNWSVMLGTTTVASWPGNTPELAMIARDDAQARNDAHDYRVSHVIDSGDYPAHDDAVVGDTTTVPTGADDQGKEPTYYSDPQGTTPKDLGPDGQGKQPQ